MRSLKKVKIFVIYVVSLNSYHWHIDFFESYQYNQPMI